jgi:chitin synthase
MIMPVTQAGIFALCDIKNRDACAYTSVLPSHTWFQCPSENEYMTWFSDFGSFIGIVWFLSSAWVTRHIWLPKSQRMASIEQMFGRPFYSGTLSKNLIFHNFTV